MRFLVVSISLLLIFSCRSQKQQSAPKEIIGVDSSRPAFTFHDRGDERYAITNLRSEIYEFRYMVVTQYNPVSVLEGFYGWREKKYYRKEYEEAIDACRNLDWLDLKWRLPNEEDVKFLLFNGLGNIDDRQFNAHRGRNFDFPENGPIAWYYYGDPTTAGSFSGDPNYETQHIPAFRIQAEVIHDKKGEEAQVIARMNTTIRSRR